VLSGCISISHFLLLAFEMILLYFLLLPLASRTTRSIFSSFLTLLQSILSTSSIRVICCLPFPFTSHPFYFFPQCSTNLDGSHSFIHLLTYILPYSYHRRQFFSPTLLGFCGSLLSLVQFHVELRVSLIPAALVYKLLQIFLQLPK
jgi:hypothetical protein